MWALTLTAKLQFMSHRAGFVCNLRGYGGKLFVAVIRAKSVLGKLRIYLGSGVDTELPRTRQETLQLLPRKMYTLWGKLCDRGSIHKELILCTARGVCMCVCVCACVCVCVWERLGECTHGFIEGYMMRFFLKVNWICWPQKYFSFFFHSEKKHYRKQTNRPKQYNNMYNIYIYIYIEREIKYIYI